MTPRTFLSIVLLGLIFPVQEIWQLWRNSNEVVNWWLAINYPISIQWYFLFLGIHLAHVLLSIVFYRITFKIQALRNAAIVFLIYNLVDLTLFFVCFNQAPYALILSTVALVSLVIIHWKNLLKFFHHNKISHA